MISAGQEIGQALLNLGKGIGQLAVGAAEFKQGLDAEQVGKILANEMSSLQDPKLSEEQRAAGMQRFNAVYDAAQKSPQLALKAGEILRKYSKETQENLLKTFKGEGVNIRDRAQVQEALGDLIQDPELRDVVLGSIDLDKGSIRDITKTITSKMVQKRGVGLLEGLREKPKPDTTTNIKDALFSAGVESGRAEDATPEQLKKAMKTLVRKLTKPGTVISLSETNHLNFNLITYTVGWFEKLLLIPISLFPRVIFARIRTNYG